MLLYELIKIYMYPLKPHFYCVASFKVFSWKVSEKCGMSLTSYKINNNTGLTGRRQQLDSITDQLKEKPGKQFSTNKCSTAQKK